MPTDDRSQPRSRCTRVRSSVTMSTSASPRAAASPWSVGTRCSARIGPSVVGIDDDAQQLRATEVEAARPAAPRRPPARTGTAPISTGAGRRCARPRRGRRCRRRSRRGTTGMSAVSTASSTTSLTACISAPQELHARPFAGEQLARAAPPAVDGVALRHEQGVDPVLGQRGEGVGRGPATPLPVAHGVAQAVHRSASLLALDPRSTSSRRVADVVERGGRDPR